jgi:hypothetical protein
VLPDRNFFEMCLISENGRDQDSIGYSSKGGQRLTKLTNFLQITDSTLTKFLRREVVYVTAVTTLCKYSRQFLKDLEMKWSKET